MTTTSILQVTSISTSLIAAGGIAALSLFDIPLLRSQPASRSLPQIRWLFSRGSHTFPTAAILSTTGFLYLAFDSIPSANRILPKIVQHAVQGRSGLYLAAALLSISIAPFTSLAMIPTNFDLIERNEKSGGTNSQKSADYRSQIGAQPRSAEESVKMKDDVNQMKDLSLPQEKTVRDSSKEEDEEVRALLEKFRQLNGVRAVLIGLGGIVGLLAALQ